MYYVISSTNPRRADLPAVSYWNATTEQWGSYDTATRYDSEDTPYPLPAGEHPDAAVETMAELGVDMEGFPWLMSKHIGPARMTHCCAAATSVSDGPLYCKSCYEAVDWDYDATPVIGPITGKSPAGEIFTWDRIREMRIANHGEKK